MKTTIIQLVAAFAAFILSTTTVRPHCDTLDGPVVQDAKLALREGIVTPALKWVKREDEKKIRNAFAKTLKVRALGSDAREIADLHFFETLVRVHRAGEGEPFTGLKAVGTIDPGIAAADNALEQGSAAQLTGALSKAVADNLRDRFAKVLARKQHAEDSVEAGREYVEAYVDYVHLVESLHTLTSPAAEKHHPVHADVHKQ